MLSPEEKKMAAITRRLDAIENRVNEMNKYAEYLTAEGKDYIIDNSYDPLYGARPIKRFIQNNLETLIARYILSHELELGDRIYVDSDGTDLTVSQS